jgi:toxin secretion/phage lysis holin
MNNELWRWVKWMFAALISFIGGLHTMIQLLIYAIAFDLATGIMAAWIEGRVSSDVSRRGVGRKVLILLGVAAAEITGKIAGLEIAVPWGGVWGLGAAVAAYYSIHEGISIAENIGRAGVPLPRFLVDRLQKLRDMENTQ